MNLQLIKIKKQNVFDYNQLAEFMIKKNGRLIFNAGFGNTDKVGEKKQKEKIDFMEKVEKKFQMKSILKSYNEAFHLHRKSVVLHKPHKKNSFIPSQTLPYLRKRKEILNIKSINYSNKNKRLTRSALKTSNYNTPIKGKTEDISLGRNLKNEPLDSNGESTISYNTYFYNRLESHPEEINQEQNEDYLYNNNSTSGKNFYSKNRKRKLLKSNSEDFIYIFGKNKIIKMNKKDKKNKKIYSNTLYQNRDNTKNPFIDYNADQNLHKIKNRLKKKFQFVEFENFEQIKREYIMKIRKLLKNKRDVQYHYEYLPSHNSVKNIIRKREEYEKKN